MLDLSDCVFSSLLFGWTVPLTTFTIPRGSDYPFLSQKLFLVSSDICISTILHEYVATTYDWSCACSAALDWDIIMMPQLHKIK